MMHKKILSTLRSTKLKYSCRLTLATAGVIAVSLPAFTGSVESYAAGSYDWPQSGGNAQHTYNNTSESIINTSTVSSLHQSFQISLPSLSDAQPVALHNVATPSGQRDLLFVNTRYGTTMAIDAHTGATVWSHQYGPNGCQTPMDGVISACYANSAPAVDPSHQYVYSYGLDGYAHKYQVGEGAEITNGGWPELTSAKVDVEKESSSLTTLTDAGGTSYLYVTNGGYNGDQGDYQGHITAINLSTGSQRVFNVLCSDQTVHFVKSPDSPDCAAAQAAVWARNGVTYDSDNNRIYITSGNGNFDPSAHMWGNSVLALRPDGTGANGGPLDSYTPGNYQSLQNNDTDLGSSGIAVLPVPSNSAIHHLGFQTGKDSILRLLDLDNLSGQGGPGHTDGVVWSANSQAGGEVHDQPVVWTNPGDNSTWIFLAATSLEAWRLTFDGSGRPSLQFMWAQGGGRASALIANNILYFQHGTTIDARAAASGQLLWSGSLPGSTHWQTPLVFNGMVYAADMSGHLTAFAPQLSSSTPTPPPATNTPTPPPATNTPTPPPATNTPAPPTATNTPVPTVAYPAPTAAPAPPSSPSFSTSFEATDALPSWTNTVDGGGYPRGGSQNVSGVCCGLTAPEAGVRAEIAHTGSQALLYSGHGHGAAYAYLNVFDVSHQPLTVTPSTTLSYWIYPQDGFVGAVGANSTCVALDLIFADGSNLRDSGAVDQQGVRLHPAYQCRHLVMNTWNKVVAPIGAAVAGRTIVRLDVGYDQPQSAGSYRGYIDDISINTGGTGIR